jgi:hypothetical protein
MRFFGRILLTYLSWLENIDIRQIIDFLLLSFYSFPDFLTLSF